MSNFKLFYFDVRGLGEPIRLMLHYGRKDFVDYRFQWEEWLELKESMPFGKVPVLEIDKKKCHQSIAICRYLGKQLGLAGNDFHEDLNIDIAVETFQDLRLEIQKYYIEKDENKKKQLYEKLLGEIIPFYLTRLDDMVKCNNGYLANSKLSWGDIYVAGVCDTLSGIMEKDIFANDYPNFNSMRETVCSIPHIQEYIQKRPKTIL